MDVARRVSRFRFPRCLGVRAGNAFGKRFAVSLAGETVSALGGPFDAAFAAQRAQRGHDGDCVRQGYNVGIWTRGRDGPGLVRCGTDLPPADPACACRARSRSRGGTPTHCGAGADAGARRMRPLVAPGMRGARRAMRSPA